LETYAGRADCSLESARSLLKRIFRKTGTSRQSELVKLVLAGPAAMVQ
jgi:DNA-binding CsgD family transcriptional regulator